MIQYIFYKFFEKFMNFLEKKNQIIYLGNTETNIGDQYLIRKFNRYLERFFYSNSDIPLEFTKGKYTIVYDDIIQVWNGKKYEKHKIQKIIRLNECRLNSEILPSIELRSFFIKKIYLSSIIQMKMK